MRNMVFKIGLIVPLATGALKSLAWIGICRTMNHI